MSKRVPIYNPETFMQGDTWAMTVDVQDNNGAPVNLTGYTATYELRERAGSASLLKLTSSSGGGIVITEATGRIALTITATQSAALTFNRAKVQLKIISGGGVVQTLFYGDQEVISRIAV